MEQEDVLLVSELSRLGRSLGQIIFLVDRMLKKQIRFVAIKEGIDLFGKQDLQMKVLVTMFGLFAEIERDLISERTKEGLAAARAKGKILVAVRLHAVVQRLPRRRPKGVLGKSKLDGKEQEIRMLLAKGVSKSAIAQIMSVSRATIRHFIKTRQLA